jgi:hypothetical protein
VIDLAVAALCSFTYSVSPAIQSPYGAAIDRAITVVEAAASAEFTRVDQGGDLEYLPMPPLKYYDPAGVVVGVNDRGDVFLAVLLPKGRGIGLTPAKAHRVRVNIAFHETLHWLGISHSQDMLPYITEARPVVPPAVAAAINAKCGVE